MFPGAATFAWGSVISSSFGGDQVKHTLWGADVTLVVDVEGILEDNGSSAFGHGLKGALGGGALSILFSASGNFNLTYGPNTSLTYGASNLSVTRGGPVYAYKTDTNFEMDFVGRAVSALGLVIAAGAVAADLGAHVFTAFSPNEHLAEWATLCTRALVQRLMGVLRLLEECNAIAKTVGTTAQDALDAAKDAKDAAQAAQKAAADSATAAKNASTTVQTSIGGAKIECLASKRIRDATDQITTLPTSSAARQRQGHHPRRKGQALEARTYSDDYSLTANNISLNSTCDKNNAATAISISALGGRAGNNGMVKISGTQSAKIGSGSAWLELTPKDAVLKNDTDGKIAIQQLGNGPAVTISLTGGEVAALALSVAPAATLDMAAAEVKLALADASITLTPASLTLKFAESTLTINQAGIILKVGASELNVSAQTIKLDAPNIEQIADLEHKLKTLTRTVEIRAQDNKEAALSLTK